MMRWNGAFADGIARIVSDDCAAGDWLMKIVAFVADGAPRLGLIEDGEVIDLAIAEPGLPGDLAAVLARYEGDLRPLAAIAARAGRSARRPLAGLNYALPVASPRKVICLGLNYLEHVREGSYADKPPAFPTLFSRTVNSLVPHLAPLVRPRVTATLDYEAELVAVIGKRARHATPQDALACVAGWTCGNEGSVREFQRHTSQWHMGKNFDRSGSVGPWMVSADALPPGAKGLAIESRLNGKVMQSDNTANMMFPVADTIAYLTQGITLEPGDLLFTGTPSGVGHARKPPVWMQPGDVCEIEIEGIGVLRNPVAAEE
jgi:acylpyruvate hydrolase